MALTQVQLARELERIISKKTRGEKLTRKEQRIYAYGGAAARCPSCYQAMRFLR